MSSISMNRGLNFSKTRPRNSSITLLAKSRPMAVHTVNESARDELVKVMEWFKTAKTEPRSHSSSRCTDEDRFEICGPLLTALGLLKQVPIRY